MPALSAPELQDFLAEIFPQTTSWNLEVLELGDRRLRLRMPVGYAHLRPGGTVSGPTMMGFADAAMYMLLLSHGGARVTGATTTSFTMNFLRRPAEKSLIGEARALKLGRTLAVGEMTLYSEGEPEPVAHATATYAIPA